MIGRKTNSEPSVYYLVRTMRIGQKSVYPYENYNAVRSAASYARRHFKFSYKVIKLGPVGSKGDIEITRIA